MNNFGTDGRHSGIGLRFQEETKYAPEKMGGYTLNWPEIAEQYKNYESCITRIKLPKPEPTGNPDIWKALQKRRSRRNYSTDKALILQQISCLLWATQGVTARWGNVYFRTAPSAGGLYPVETYLSVRLVVGLEPGIYHFRPGIFDLEFIEKGDKSKDLTSAALEQDIVGSSQATFIWSAIIARDKWKYRERTYRYIYLDAGHICQNLYLAAESLELGVCAIGAFYDDVVNKIVGVDGIEETAIYMATVGLRSEISEF